MSKVIVAVAAVGVFAAKIYGADPSESLYGTVGAYQRSQTIKVGYEHSDEATKAVHALGFEVVEDYHKGKFLVVRLKDKRIEDVGLKQLVALAAHPSVRTLSPNEKMIAIGPAFPRFYRALTKEALTDELSPKQMRLYQARQRLPETVAIEVVEFNALDFAEDGTRTVKVTLSGQDLEIPLQISTQKDCRTLVGKTNSGASVALKLSGNNLVGTIEYNDRTYTFESLGRGLHTVAEDDHSRIPIKRN